MCIKPNNVYKLLTDWRIFWVTRPRYTRLIWTERVALPRIMKLLTDQVFGFFLMSSILGRKMKMNVFIRGFLSGLKIRWTKTDLADEQHSTCINNEYHALYLTADPRSCSLRFRSAGRSSKILSPPYSIAKTLRTPKAWSLVWTSSRPHSCRCCEGQFNTCSRRCKAQHWHSCCSCTNSSASSITWLPWWYRTRLMQTAILDTFQEDVGV